MSDMRIKSAIKNVPRATGDGAWTDLRGTRDGALIKAPWYTAAMLEGRAFGVHVGVDTSPATFNAGNTAAKQDLLVAVPTGAAIIPVAIEVLFEDTGTAETVDVIAVASAVYDIADSSTATTIYNMRTDAPIKSMCTVHTKVTANGTTPYTGNYVEFFRGPGGKCEDAINTGTDPFVNLLVMKSAWYVGNALVPPVIVGQGSLSIYASAQAGKGYIKCMWIEIPIDDID